MSLVRTVKVSNVSLGATEQNIAEFFSCAGEVEYIELQRLNELSQIAYVTFKYPPGAEMAVLLTGSTIVDQSISVVPEPTTKLPPGRTTAAENKNPTGAGSAIQKAEDVVSSMLAKGFILGKDALTKAKALDEKHHVTSTASAKAASVDHKIGLTEKLSAGTTIVNEKMKEMDEKFQVSEKAKSAGTAIMKNRYVLTGTSWVSGALSRVTKAAEEVGEKTKEKVVEEELQRNAAQGYVQGDDIESQKAAINQQPTYPSAPIGEPTYSSAPTGGTTYPSAPTGETTYLSAPTGGTTYLAVPTVPTYPSSPTAPTHPSAPTGGPTYPSVPTAPTHPSAPTAPTHPSAPTGGATHPSAPTGPI